MKLRKLRNIVQIEPDAYQCNLEVWEDILEKWNKVSFVAKKVDNSPISQWVFQEIATGKYKITT
jgi:hypothetical protein